MKLSNFETPTLPSVMLVDMNSFFASVEQQANPKYRGKPLGVCASLHPTSCLIAASKEAKALGIKTGTLIYKARKIYPDILLVEAEPEKYREVNRRINAIFSDYTDWVESYSIDESFLDLSETRFTVQGGAARIGKCLLAAGFKPQDFAQNPYAQPNPKTVDALLIGAEIKQRIREEVGEWLTCSVGIAPNKYMAKLAADLKKPDGLTVIWRKNLPEIYKHKSFRDLWGIARGWERRLTGLGIPGPYEMLSYPVANLLAVFGKPGFYVWQRVQGLEVDKIPSNGLVLDGSAARIVERLPEDGFEPSVAAESPYAQPQPVPLNDQPKSFGHSWVLNFRTTDKSKLAPVIMRLAEKAARRMRAGGFQSSGIYLSITDTIGSRFHISKKLRKPINTGHELYLEALNLWRSWVFKFEIVHIAVGFSNLTIDSLQLDLFGDKTKQLTKTLDLINDRYGEFTIRSGMLAQTQNFAPDAIAFGK